MKILESNKVLQSVFSGMAINYLNTEYQNGYIRDIYNECKVVMNSSNSITVSTGMIVVEGIRLLFEEAETFNITSFPDSSLLHHLVLKVTATTEGENKAEIINRINEPLRQDEILKNGSGVYELELASYLLSPNGISNFAQTLLPIILTNEELQSFKEMIDELDKKVDALDQVIITANEDAERALTTVSNLTVGTVQKGVDPAASIDVDVIKKTAKLNLTLPKGDKGDNGTVITIDGEPQDYYDGDFINNLEAESTNEVRIVNGTYTTSAGLIVTVTENNIITLNGNVTTGGGVVHIPLVEPLPVGTYSLNLFNAVKNDYNSIGFTAEDKLTAGFPDCYFLDGIRTGTTTKVAHYLYVYLNNRQEFNYSNLQFKVMLVKGNTIPKTFGFYNQKRNITNPQAEYLKEKYNESANLFDGVYDLAKKYINPSTGQYATAGDLKASSKLYSLNNAKKIYFKISEAFRSMVLLFYDANGSYLNEYVSLNNKSSAVYEIQGNAKYFRTYTAEENNENIMISAYDLPYQPYNQKEHITNEQANCLKESFEKQFNLLNENKYLGQYCTYANGKWTTKTAGGYNYSIFTNQAGQTYDRDITKLPFLKAGTYTVIIYNVENNTTADDIIFAQIDANGKYVAQLEVFDMDNLINGCIIDHFTVTEDFYLDIRHEANSGTLSFTGIAIYEGALTQVIPHYEYNSSSHITNAQADLLKRMNEKSLNLFNIRNLPSSFGEKGSAVVDYNNGTITITSQYANYSTKQLKNLAPSLVVDKEYIISASANTGNSFIYLQGTNNTWAFGTPRVLTQQDLDSFIIFYGDSGVTVTIKNIQIEEGNVAHEPQTYQGGKFVQYEEIKKFSFDESTGTLSITDN